MTEETEIYVVSYGGVGSKVLLRTLYPEASPKELKQLHIHSRQPKRFRDDNRLFIYLFGDPRNAVVSFFQRRVKRHSNHDFGLQAINERFKPNWVKKHLQHLEVDSPEFQRSWDLHDYLAHAKRDLFQFAEHFERWETAARWKKVNAVFVRYEAMWENADILAELIGVDSLDLPEFQPRSADWTSQSAEIQSRLSAMYDEFSEQLDGYPDVFVKRGRRVISPLPGPKRFTFGARQGMMAAVNSMVNSLKAHEDGRAEPFEIDDSDFLFGAWTDFFENPFDIKVDRRAGHLESFSGGFTQPRKTIPVSETLGCPHFNGNNVRRGHILMPPTDRVEANRIITKYLTLEPGLSAQIEQEKQDVGVKDKLALHIRGPGRLDGGTGWMLWKMGYNSVPFDIYFAEVDKLLADQDMDIVVFSDAQDVIETVRGHYGAKVAFRAESKREATGEGHLGSEFSDKKQLGIDIMVETHMMASARYFIHGNSNVANHVLCLNPDLPHVDIFAEFYREDYFDRSAVTEPA